MLRSPCGTRKKCIKEDQKNVALKQTKTVHIVRNPITSMGSAIKNKLTKGVDLALVGRYISKALEGGAGNRDS